MASQRISYLDGHRGLAILAVVAFHTMARWSDRVPFTGAQNFPPIAYGWIGVELFFLISGFVILMTLEKCSSAADFLFRRWLRLFPAMLVCSLLIFATASLFPERPGGQPAAEDMLPGLAFMELSWWRRVFGHSIQPLEGSFWSLFVEFKFYVFAAVAYYVGGRRALFVSLIAVFALDFASSAAEAYAPGRQETLRHILGGLPFNWFGWFAAGAALFVFSQTGRWGWFAFGLALAVASSAQLGLFGSAARLGNPGGAFIAALVVTALFATSLVSAPVQRLLSSQLLQFLGFVSYPLYLIHEETAVALLVKLGRLLPSTLYSLTPAFGMAPLVLVAYLIARHAEPWLRGLVSRQIDYGKVIWSFPRALRGTAVPEESGSQ